MSMERLSRFLFPKETKLTHIQRLGNWGARYFLEKEKTPECCPKCATFSNRIHDYRSVSVQDEPIRGHAVFFENQKATSLVSHMQKTLYRACS